MSESASTEVLRGLRVFSLPPSGRWLLLGILLVLGAVNTYLFVEGIVNDKKHEWVKASLELLSVILPFFLLAVAIFFSSSISAQTHRRTIEFLNIHAPAAFSRLREPLQDFLPASPRLRRSQLRSIPSTDVRVRHSPGSCCADYLLDLPPDAERNSPFRQSALIRMELNVRRLTFCLGIREALIPGAGDLSEMDRLKWFEAMFESTLSGARHCIDADSAHGAVDMHAGYDFNRSTTGKTEGQEYHWFVASRDLKSDFLWDASERIYILQDMLFMLRAFLSEQPSLFAKKVNT